MIQIQLNIVTIAKKAMNLLESQGSTAVISARWIIVKSAFMLAMPPGTGTVCWAAVYTFPKSGLPMNMLKGENDVVFHLI
jgi:hypothetical protein